MDPVILPLTGQQVRDLLAILASNADRLPDSLRGVAKYLGAEERPDLPPPLDQFAYESGGWFINAAGECEYYR